MNRARLHIEGMSCQGCVRGVTATLQRLPGVEVGQVSIGSAEIAFDPSQTTPQAIAAALEAAGYPARPAQDGPA